MTPEITSIESVKFAYPIEDVGTDQHGFNLMYEPGSVTGGKLFDLKTYTDKGITGEYVGGITGAIKRAKGAEGFGLDVASQAPSPAQRRCIVANRNMDDCELALVHSDSSNTQPPVYEGDYSNILDTVDDDGTVKVPDGASPCVDYDWAYSKDNATGSVHTYN